MEITSANHSPVQLRFPELYFSEEDWPCALDLLDRHKEIENLSPVLLNVQAPLVFAIDAPWGAGKTTFIKLWQHYLQTQGHVSLYLNAWESDFAEDPLLPMLSVLDSWIVENTDSSVAQDAWKKAKKFTPAILKATAVATAKAATFGALDLDKEYEKLASELMGSAVSSLVDGFNVKKAALKQFKDLVVEAMEALPEEQQNLIIFVDELDRCKPTYAIEMLERIKHLFDIDRLVFVLAINRDQLSKSLQGVYGPTFDGNHYLKRFIDLDYQLRVPDHNAYIRARLNQPDIKEYFGKRRDGGNALENFREIIFGLTSRFEYKLRDIDQLITRLRLILRSIPRNDDVEEVVLSSLIVLREQNSALYEKYVADKSSANDVIEYLMGSLEDANSIPEYYGLVGGVLISSGRNTFHEDDLEPLIKPWEVLLKKLDEKSEKYKQVERLIRIAKHSQNDWIRSDVRKTTFDRIELVSQIDIGNA